MKTVIFTTIYSLFAIILCVHGCQAHQGAQQKSATLAVSLRPIPTVGPYFRELAERARKTGHVYDRFRLFQEMENVFSAPGGSVVPGCRGENIPAPVGGVDDYLHAHKDLKDLFEKGDAHAGYLLESPSRLEEAYKRGDPYATLLVIGRIANAKRTHSQVHEEQEAAFKLEFLANKGDRQALYLLADPFFGKDRADHWYEKLKEQPDRLTYKAMYYRGASGGIPRNGALVLEAAEHGEARAMSRLAEHFYYGSEPFSGLAMKDLQKAWFWLRKFREAVGCPSPEEAPPIDMDTDKPWIKPKSKQPVRKR